MLTARTRYSGENYTTANLLCGHPCCGDLIASMHRHVGKLPAGDVDAVVPVIAWHVWLDQGYRSNEHKPRRFELGQHARHSYRRAPRRPMRVSLGDGRRIQGGARFHVEGPGGRKLPGDDPYSMLWLANYRLVATLIDPDTWGSFQLDDALPVTIACPTHGHQSEVSFKLLESERAKLTIYRLHTVPA